VFVERTSSGTLTLLEPGGTSSCAPKNNGFRRLSTHETFLCKRRRCGLWMQTPFTSRAFWATFIGTLLAGVIVTFVVNYGGFGGCLGGGCTVNDPWGWGAQQALNGIPYFAALALLLAVLVWIICTAVQQYRSREH
jgi:hypothetical protein